MLLASPHENPRGSWDFFGVREQRGGGLGVCVFFMRFRMRVNPSDLVIVTGSLVNLHFPLSVGQDYSQGIGYIKKTWVQQRDRCSSWGPPLFVEHICSQNPILLYYFYILHLFFGAGCVLKIWHLSLWNGNSCKFSHPRKMVFSFLGPIPLIVISDHPSKSPRSTFSFQPSLQPAFPCFFQNLATKNHLLPVAASLVETGRTRILWKVEEVA